MKITFEPIGLAATAGYGYRHPSQMRDWPAVPRVGDVVELLDDTVLDDEDLSHARHVSGTVVSVGWVDGPGLEAHAIVRFR